jgi:hypothetical protein
MLESAVELGELSRLSGRLREQARSHSGSAVSTAFFVWERLLAKNDNAVYAGSTLSKAWFTANSASMMIC